jgi:Kelch motif
MSEDKCVVCESQAFSTCHLEKYCNLCLSKHIISKKSIPHVCEPLDLVKGTDCEICGDKSNIRCSCRGEKHKFCSKCFAIHLNIDENTAHAPEALYEDQDISDQYPLLKDRAKRIDYLKFKVQENIEKVSEFEKSLENEKLDLENSIESFYDELEGQIKQSELYLNTILEELNKCKNDSEISEDSIIKKYNLQITKNKQMKIIETEIDSTSIVSSIKNFATISLKRESFKIDSRIFYFKPRSKELSIIEISSAYVLKKIFPKSFGLKDSGSWCEIPNRLIFYCGGTQGSTFSAEAYIIDPYTFSINKLPDMKQSRALSSVLYWNDYVYVFGGYSGNNLSTCEKYNLKTNTWTLLTSMPVTRSAFSIVVYKDCLYMTGDNCNLDRYNPYLDTFDTFNNILPEFSAYSTLACNENILYVIQNKLLIEIDLQSFKIVYSSPIPEGKWWSYFPAVIYDNEICFSRYDDASIWSYHIKTKTISKKYRI